MITQSLHGNNRLIQKTIWRMYPSSFTAAFTVNIALMVDTLLAGSLLGQKAIAAVAIGLPSIGIFQALTQTIVNGAAVKMAVYAGRGDQKKLNNIFSLGLFSTLVLGSIFLGVCLIFAEPLTRFFGGAANPEVARQAAFYLRASSVCILMGSLNNYVGKVLALYGYQKDVFFAALIALTGNLFFSTLYIYLLPDAYAIIGLGAGTWTGGFMALCYSSSALRRRKIPLKAQRKNLAFEEVPDIVRLGIPTSGNNLADSFVAGIVNKIIVAAFAGDTTVLSIYTAVKGVYTFAITSIMSTTTASSPLLGLLYGARDKTGLLRTFRESLKVGLITSVCWCGVIIAALPLLGRFYSMSGNPQFQHGVLVCMIFIPLWLLMRVFIQIFESTGNTAMGLLYSIFPDSVIYPVLLALLMPVLGYNGIWIAYGANALPFLVVVYLIRSLKHKTLTPTPERLLYLDKTIRDRVPMLDISIQSTNTDVTGISQQVHEFLAQEQVSRRTAYMTALCLEELAADFVTHTQTEPGIDAEKTIMDIKIFSDEETLRMIIRNVADAYNPLDFDLDSTSFAKVGVKLAQKVARRIEYNYVYRMNIVTIDINK